MFRVLVVSGVWTERLLHGLGFVEMASGSVGQGGSNKVDLQELMKTIGLEEEDLDDVVFENEDPSSAESTRWLAIIRLHVEKEYSDFCFFKNMSTTWDLAWAILALLHT